MLYLAKEEVKARNQKRFIR